MPQQRYWRGKHIMKHDAKNVANRLINYAVDEDSPLTPMQVQKLTYFCHAWMLGLHDEPLVRQNIEAWQYGPVIRDLYLSLQRYGRRPVTRLMKCRKESYVNYESDIIREVWQKYGHLTGPQLSTLSHEGGTPWHQVWHDPARTEPKPIIPNSLIRGYYKGLWKGPNGNR